MSKILLKNCLDFQPPNIVGFCWWCLDLLLMPVLGGCSDNIAVPKNTKTVKAKKTHKHIQKTHGNTKSLAQTFQNGRLGVIFKHPCNKNEAFWDTLGPKNRQSGPLGSNSSAKGPHNEIFGLLLMGTFWWTKGLKKEPFSIPFGVLTGPMVAIKSAPEEK